MLGIDNATVDLTADYDKTALSVFEKAGLIAIEKKAEDQNMASTHYGQAIWDVRWTPKAISLRDEKHSDTHWLGIQCGACKVQTIVKNIEYHASPLPQSDDYRLVVGTYELKTTNFTKSAEGIGGEDGVFKFRALIKLNPFNQTYSYVTGDFGKVDADGWQTENIPQN